MQKIKKIYLLNFLRLTLISFSIFIFFVFIFVTVASSCKCFYFVYRSKKVEENQLKKCIGPRTFSLSLKIAGCFLQYVIYEIHILLIVHVGLSRAGIRYLLIRIHWNEDSESVNLPPTKMLIRYRFKARWLISVKNLSERVKEEIEKYHRKSVDQAMFEIISRNCNTSVPNLFANNTMVTIL